jgi:D-sedoheptulose 7-phosphate isomerase
MNKFAQIRAEISASIAAKEALLADEACLAQVEGLAARTVASLRAGGKIIFAGNGGSFADAQHLSAEFSSRFRFDRAPLASLALGTNSSAMSAIGNDYGYDQIFARELAAIGRPEDVFIPISTSGRSPNVLAAARVARDLGIHTVGFSGAGPSAMTEVCACIQVPSQETARIQECHILIGHILCGLVEQSIFAAS